MNPALIASSTAKLKDKNTLTAVSLIYCAGIVAKAWALPADNDYNDGIMQKSRFLRHCLHDYAFSLYFLSLIAVPAVNLLPLGMQDDSKSQFIYVLEVFCGLNVILNYQQLLPRFMVILAALIGPAGILISALNWSGLELHYGMGACYFIFFFISAFTVFKRVIYHHATNRETLSAALSGYILIGFIAYFLFLELQQLLPGSFVLSSTGKDAGANELFYFAFVTIMTIGYGDIAPISWPARNATILMAILGYLYSLVFIARVVNDLGSFNQKTKAIAPPAPDSAAAKRQNPHRP